MDDTTDWSSFRFPPAPPDRWRARRIDSRSDDEAQRFSQEGDTFQSPLHGHEKEKEKVAPHEPPSLSSGPSSLPDFYSFDVDPVTEFDHIPESMAPLWAVPPQRVRGWHLQQSGRMWTIVHPLSRKKIDLLRVCSRRRLVGLTEIATKQKNHVDVSTLFLALEQAIQRAFRVSLPHMLAWGAFEWEWPSLDVDPDDNADYEESENPPAEVLNAQQSVRGP